MNDDKSSSDGELSQDEPQDALIDLGIENAEQRARIAELEAENLVVWAENERLRKLLWLGHEGSTRSLYGDDGEMQCNHPDCMLDFKRDSVDKIERRFQGRALAVLDTPNPPPDKENQ
ncbi:hypothetical protein KAR91_13925 [Candidatus Pacearchaeota archaeon]|nr:hypothetical protein [Candidatus Pacearchaeota archaeon]